MNNKERFLTKIGKLIEKGNVTEEELASFFAPDEPIEEPKGAETPKAEQADEKPQGEVAASEDGKEGEPSEPQAEPKAEEPQTAQENNVAQAPIPTPEGTAEAGTPNNSISMEAMMQKIESMSQAIEGMSRENESLRKALKEANVLCDNTPDAGNPIGLDGNSAPSKGQDEDTMNVLARLNRGRH